ncbi:hypothetical protein [Dietzia sp.]|uniref:hypothetical protein n=1 Tax=Dietzia sp. TaxID=1871616 RepID=UPI002FDA124A
MNPTPTPFVRIQELTEGAHEGLAAAAQHYAALTTDLSADAIRFELDGLAPLSNDLIDAIAADLGFDDGHIWLREFLTGSRVDDRTSTHVHRVRELVRAGVTLRRVVPEQ